MPHFMIDYSSNLEAKIDMSELCNVIRNAAIETGIFPLAGVRVRAAAATHVSIADGREIHGFIDLSVRLRAGRPATAKREATAHIFSAFEDFLAPILNENSIALSMEMRDIDPDFSPKAGTIREYLTT